MAVSGVLTQSLSKMSVQADIGVGNQALLMPKLQFRFRVVFAGLGALTESYVITQQVMDVTRPNVTFAEIPLNVYNSTLYLAGKHTWQPITLNVRDDVTGSVSRIVGDQLQKQLDFAEMASAASGQDYKFSMGIEMLDGNNGQFSAIVVESWELYGCYLSSVNYNTLNYATNDAATLNLTIRYDNAVQVKDGNPAGVGGPTRQNRSLTGVATGAGSLPL